ncbi:MAG: hypothetical protein QOF58_3614 [Pseudonocardiales bacterium]|nr:hypothetical protein [Pseudonocardiales bacterium]
MPVCGNRARHAEGTPVAHASVAAIRACFLEEEVWPCSWLVELTNPEDGESTYVECAGLTWYLPGNRGYACENGHEHIYDHVRADEGWDYVADPEEAGLLAGRGVRPVAMNGGSIDIDHGAFRYAAGLPG